MRGENEGEIFGGRSREATVNMECFSGDRGNINEGHGTCMIIVQQSHNGIADIARRDALFSSRNPQRDTNTWRNLMFPLH